MIHGQKDAYIGPEIAQAPLRPWPTNPRRCGSSPVPNTTAAGRCQPEALRGPGHQFPPIGSHRARPSSRPRPQRRPAAPELAGEPGLSLEPVNLLTKATALGLELTHSRLRVESVHAPDLSRDLSGSPVANRVRGGWPRSFWRRRPMPATSSGGCSWIGSPGTPTASSAAITTFTRSGRRRISAARCRSALTTAMSPTSTRCARATAGPLRRRH